MWRGRWRHISRLRIFVKPSTSFVQHSRISGCWWRLGWQVHETTIRHPRSAGSSFSSLKVSFVTSLLNCLNRWLRVLSTIPIFSSSGWTVIYLCQSTPVLVTREAKWRLSFSGTWSNWCKTTKSWWKKLQCNIFVSSKNKYRKSFWEGRVVGTPNFLFCDSLPWLFDQSIFNSDPISNCIVIEIHLALKRTR